MSYPVKCWRSLCQKDPAKSKAVPLTDQICGSPNNFVPAEDTYNASADDAQVVPRQSVDILHSSICASTPYLDGFIARASNLKRNARAHRQASFFNKAP